MSSGTEAVPTAARRRRALTGGLWAAASQVVPAAGTAVLSVAAGRVLGSSALGQQSLIAYVNSAAASIVIYALNTALLQLGGRLQGQGDVVSLRALTRWSVRAHLASGVVVLGFMAGSAVLVGHNTTAWLVIGAVSILDAVADGLAVRIILVEGWGPLGRLRLVFQLLGPPLGIAFLLAGFGITGIFVGDGIAALGLLVAVALRARTLRSRSLLPDDLPAAPDASAAGAAPVAGAPVPAEPVPGIEPTPAVWTFRDGRWGPADTGGRHRPAPGSTRPSPRAGSRAASRAGRPVGLWRSYGLFGVDAVIQQVVTRRVEFVVLAIFATDAAIGMYSVAFMAVNLIAMIPLGVAAAAMPIVAAAEGRGELDAANRHLRLALRLGSMVSVPLVALLAAVGPVAVTLVYGDAYDEAARLVPFASLALLVAVVSGLCAQFWAGQGRLSIVLGSGAVAGVADLAVAFALVPVLGTTGAVAANLAGQAGLATALLVATVRRTGPIGWQLRGMLRTLAIGVLAGLAAWGVVQAVGSTVGGVEFRALLQLLAGTAAFGVVAAVVAVVLRPFADDESTWLAPLLPGRARPLVTRLTVSAP